MFGGATHCFWNLNLLHMLYLVIFFTLEVQQLFLLFSFPCCCEQSWELQPELTCPIQIPGIAALAHSRWRMFDSRQRLQWSKMPHYIGKTSLAATVTFSGQIIDDQQLCKRLTWRWSRTTCRLAARTHRVWPVQLNPSERIKHKNVRFLRYGKHSEMFFFFFNLKLKKEKKNPHRTSLFCCCSCRTWRQGSLLHCPVTYCSAWRAGEDQGTARGDDHDEFARRTAPKENGCVCSPDSTSSWIRRRPQRTSQRWLCTG